MGHFLPIVCVFSGTVVQQWICSYMQEVFITGKLREKPVWQVVFSALEKGNVLILLLTVSVFIHALALRCVDVGIL